MYHLQKKVVNGLYILACVSIIALIFSGCAPKSGQKIGKSEEAGQHQPPAEEKVVESIEVSQSAAFTEVLIKGNKKLTYTSIKQSFPFGIAVYLPGAKIGKNISNLMPEKGGINSILPSYADKEEQTVKIEILLNREFSYKIEEENEDKSLRVLIDREAVEKIMTGSVADDTQGEDYNQADIDTEPAGMESQEVKIDIPEGTAELTGIEFDTEDGGVSEITIETSHPVAYSFSEKQNGIIQMNLPGTYIPVWHMRPLETKYFKSAVERVLPKMIPGETESAFLEIKMREKVPYHVVRDENEIVVSFEPSSIEPPKFAAAEKEPTSDQKPPEQPASGKGVLPAEGKRKQPATQKTASESLVPTDKKEYTGEKIKLDFFETDIKNVFRILGSISGKNFAVDKDVEGSVTLTLDKPVPWDQVLDLVLKMNNLGKTMEGDVIRIATHDSLKREQDMLRAKIEAIKKAREQKKSLEPLVTEYIPINYASAESDIKPHLEKIKTPDRGSLSVNSRTNMIIITDTQEKIEQAKEAIFRLDKVTPQIMIKAKVIEANENFSRQFGFDWGMGQSEVYRDDLGGTYGWDVAMNHPVESASSIGYTFSRITGTPFTLNATLTASETKGDVKIISSPRIITLDNKPALIKQGIEVAYQTVEDNEVNIEFKEIVLELEVEPHVTPDDRIKMTLNIKKEDISEITETGEPAIATNEAQTELLVDNNDTVVIGGIVKKSITTTQSGFPILSDLPVLGKLFGSDIDTEEKNELMIFITPEIIQLEQKKVSYTEEENNY